jgi:hypothetical protein
LVLGALEAAEIGTCGMAPLSGGDEKRGVGDPE